MATAADRVAYLRDRYVGTRTYGEREYPVHVNAATLRVMHWLEYGHCKGAPGSKAIIAGSEWEWDAREDYLYSYGTHHDLLHRISTDTVRLNLRKYSVTTSRHTSACREALRLMGYEPVASVMLGMDNCRDSDDAYQYYVRNIYTFPVD